MLAPDGDGSQRTGLDTSDPAARLNIVLNAFRIMINGGLSLRAMVDGVVDEFEDATGIDAASSTGETYHPYDAVVSNVANGAALSILDAKTSDNAGVAGFGGLGVQDHCAVSFTLSQPVTVTKAVLDVHSVTTAGLVRVSLYHHGSATPLRQTDHQSVVTGGEVEFDLGGNVALEAGQAYVLEFDSDIVGGAGLIVSLVDDPGTDIEWSRISSGTSAAATGNALVKAGYDFRMGFRVSYGGAASDMVLVANPQTADAPPDAAFLVVWFEAIDAVTLNTDLLGFVSRDGGTTWAPATLVQEASLGDGGVLAAAEVDIAGQPAGTSMVWKIETANGTGVKLHGVALEWS